MELYCTALVCTETQKGRRSKTPSHLSVRFQKCNIWNSSNKQMADDLLLASGLLIGKAFRTLKRAKWPPLNVRMCVCMWVYNVAYPLRPIAWCFPLAKESPLVMASSNPRLGLLLIFAACVSIECVVCVIICKEVGKPLSNRLKFNWRSLSELSSNFLQYVSDVGWAQHSLLCNFTYPVLSFCFCLSFESETYITTSICMHILIDLEILHFCKCAKINA